MIAMVDDENSCHSSSSRKSGERYISFSIIIIIDPSLTPLLHSPLPSVEEYTRLSTQTYILQKMNFTSLLMNEGKTKILAGKVVIFQTFALARIGVGEFFA